MPVISHGWETTPFFTNQKRIYYKTFVKKYKPLEEWFWVNDDKFIEQMNKPNGDRNVWTIHDEDGYRYIQSGYHLVNRIDFFITENQWEKYTHIQIPFN
tara:strand:+ start:464 stop:760 length:297 start_codon:yes stop_codon:yes gene_type:complete